MAHLIAIGYDHETTAALAEQEVERLSWDLHIEPDAVAVIARDGDGRYRVHTNHHAVEAGSTWGMFWEMFFGSLFFVPVFGMAVGEGLGELMTTIEAIGVDPAFPEQARELLQPGTSELYMAADEVSPEQVAAALGRFGGALLETPMSSDAEAELQRLLHGGPAPV